jgi:hypothetical protein
MKKKSAEYQNLYPKNADTNAYIIEVSLDDYGELFNGWDASPLRKKDLEPELLDYLEQAGFEIPLKEKVEICFYLSEEIRDIDKETKSITGVKNNFRVVMFFINKTLMTTHRQVFVYMSMSILLLIFAYLIRNIEAGLLLSILIEGLFIGGWFLLWEAFSSFFFTGYETRHRRRVFTRFTRCPVYFSYKPVIPQ